MVTANAYVYSGCPCAVTQVLHAARRFDPTAELQYGQSGTLKKQGPRMIHVTKTG